MTTPNLSNDFVIIAVPATAYYSTYGVGPFRRCAECFEVMSDDDQGARHGVDGCDNCLMACERCDDVCVVDETVSVFSASFGDCERWCENCAEEYSGMCGRCDETHRSSDLRRDRNLGIRMCPGCTEAEEERQAEQEAEEEAGENAGTIGDYHNRDRHFMTRPIHGAWTHSNGDRFLGVELELECPEMRWRDVEGIAADLLQCVNHPGESQVMWAERDGSLSNGFELITQPMGLDAQVALWSSVLGHASVGHLRSHNTTTCGLHVHVSRAGLSQLTIAKAVVFLNDRRNMDLISGIARRWDSGYSKQKTVKLGKRAATDPDRYVMLNTLPQNTVEFRLFRGTTKPETVLGCIEFANAALNFCHDTPPAKLLTQDFIAWLHRPANRLDSKHLRALLARRSPSLLGEYLPKPNPRKESPTVTTSEE